MVSARKGARALIFWTFIAMIAIGIGYLAQRSAKEAAALVVAGCLGVLVVRRDMRVLLPLAVAALAWGSSVLPGAGSVAFYAKFGLLAAIGLTAVIVALSPGDHLPVPLPFAIAFGALLVWALASTSWSVSPDDTIYKSVSMLIVWTAAVIAIPTWTRDERDVRSVILAFGVTAAVVMVLGVAGGMSGLFDAFRDSHRFNGLLNDANAIGYWAAPIIPALVLMATRTPSGRKRVVIVASVVVLTIAIALSGSRGGSIAAASGVVVGFLAAGATGQWRSAARAIGVAIVALAAAFLIFPALGLGVRSTQTATEGLFQVGTGSNRAPAWGAAIRTTDEAPWIGHGFATTPVIFPLAQSVTTQAQVLERTHNSYLEAAIDLGWPGTIWLACLATSGLLAAWRVARRPGPWQAIGTILLAGVVGGMVEGLFESGLLAAGGLLAFPFWSIVALSHSVRLAQRRGLPALAYADS
jgi:O-antigen ligase